MVTLPVRFLPYFKHFFFVVVVSHLVLAAIYFTVGTITRNAKIVYGLAACFYPAYVAFMLFLKDQPNVRVLLDPLGFNFHLHINEWRQSADFLNKYVVTYRPYAYANRAWMLIVTALCLFIVYRWFAIDEQTKHSADPFTILTLPRASDTVPYGLEISPSNGFVDSAIEVSPASDRIRSGVYGPCDLLSQRRSSRSCPNQVRVASLLSSSKLSYLSRLVQVSRRHRETGPG